MKTYFITLRDFREAPRKTDFVFGLVPVRDYIIKNPIKGGEPLDSKLDFKNGLIYFYFEENKCREITSIEIERYVLEYYFRWRGMIKNDPSPKDPDDKEIIPLEWAIIYASCLIDHYDWKKFHEDLEKLYDTILKEGINKMKDLEQK